MQDLHRLLPEPTFMTSTLLRIALSATVFAVACAPAQAADLTDIYHQALRNDPQLREAEDVHLATLEARPQALSALLPQINGSASAVDDHLNSREPGYQVGSTQPTFSTASRTDTTQWSVQLRQTIFRWDQFATLKQSDAVVAEAEANYRAAQQAVIVRTAQAYFGVLSARDTLDYAEASREAITRQQEQAEKRYEVGLIAITDVEEAKAAADQAAATVIAAKRSLADALDQLRELTGETVDELSRPGDDMPLIAPNPENEESWVKAALDQNPDLTAARLAADVARENIAVARAGHYPTLDLVASRTGVNANGTVTAFDPTQQFPGSMMSQDKQIGLQLTIPLYGGGYVSSKVREAVYRHRAAREHLEATARATERGTRDAYRGVLSEIAQVRALKQAVASNTTALRATEASYDVGTRTAVDVLLARQNLLYAQSNYARARYDYVINVLLLDQQTGTLAESRLARVNAWLDHKIPVR